MERPEHVEELVALGPDLELSILRPRDADVLFDEKAFERDEMVPYWADLWPSARLLARQLVARSLGGMRVLELGCGLGLPAITAALGGARVTATDWSADAIEATLANARRNGARLDAVVCDWQEPAEIVARAPWDLVLAADVLYERRNITPLLTLLDGLGAETWIADPHRAFAEDFLTGARGSGWQVDALAAEERPRVTVHRLRRPQPS